MYIIPVEGSTPFSTIFCIACIDKYYDLIDTSNLLSGGLFEGPRSSFFYIK